MEAHTLIAVYTTDHEERLVRCVPDQAVVLIPGHRIFLRDLDGVEHTFNWRHVTLVRRMDVPATPAEGS